MPCSSTLLHLLADQGASLEALRPTVRIEATIATLDAKSASTRVGQPTIMIPCSDRSSPGMLLPCAGRCSPCLLPPMAHSVEFPLRRCGLGMTVALGDHVEHVPSERVCQFRTILEYHWGKLQTATRQRNSADATRILLSMPRYICGYAILDTEEPAEESWQQTQTPASLHSGSFSFVLSP